MKILAHYLLALLLFIPPIVEMNCVPSSYQSPRVFQPGEKAVGLGVALPATEGDVSLCLRSAVLKNMDGGIKLGGFPNYSYGIFADMKYCFIEQPLLIAADLGFLYHKDLFMSEDEPRSYGLHPTVLLGSDRIYGGIGWNYSIQRKTSYAIFPPYVAYVTTSRSSGPRIMLGASWGKSWKFNPEIIFNFDPLARPNGIVMVGCGIHRIFGKPIRD